MSGKPRHVHFPSDDNLLAAERAASPALSTASSVAETATERAASGERGVGTRSIVIMLAINFLANIVFSIVIPSIWPFLNVELLVTNKAFVGWAVAANSAGTFISAPLLGAWADKWNTRGVMAVSLVLMVAANFLYSLADKTFTLNQAANIAMLLSGRFLVGVAAGNYAVVQSYFSYATRPSQRLSVMSWNAGTTVIGFIVGPAIAAACNVKPFQLGPVHINSMTLPGYLSAVAALIALGALPFLEDCERPSAAKLAREALQEEEARANSKQYSAPGLRDSTDGAGERQALLGSSSVGRIPSRMAEAERKAGSVANYGAWVFGGSGYYAQPVQIRRDDDGSAPAVHYGSSAAYDRAKTWTGAFPVASYGSLYASARGGDGDEQLDDDVFSDPRTPWSAVSVCLLLNFTFSLTFTCLETIGPPYTAANPNVDWTDKNDGVVKNGIYFMILGVICIAALVLLQFVNKVLSDRTLLALTALLMAVGFSINVPWYDEPMSLTPAFPARWRFFLSSAITSIGYAAGCAVLLAIYSKVLEGLDQGTFMGWFSAACSTARIVGPLAASYLLNEDPTGRYIFGGLAVILIISTGVAAGSYKLLLPQCEQEDEEKNQKSIN